MVGILPMRRYLVIKTEMYVWLNAHRQGAHLSGWIDAGSGPGKKTALWLNVHCRTNMSEGSHGSETPAMSRMPVHPPAKLKNSML